MRYTKPRLVKALRLLFISLLLLMLNACQTMGPSEYAVVFSKLPWVGGIKEKVLSPGESEIVYPWIDLYRVDTRIQSISWGAKGRGDNQDREDYVESRALDGNEVGLSTTVQYHVDASRVGYVLQNVASSDERLREIVSAIARADIRTHMNVLKTRDFFNQHVRQEAVNRVKQALKTRLEPEGIIIDAVIYDDHRFERRLPDGTYDRSYQEQIDRTQAVIQETQQERKKIKTVVEKKKQEFNEAKARYNRVIEEVDGYKRQAMLRGDAYLETKQNESEQILAIGMAEVEGLKKQIAALSGPGGKALLRLALVQELIKKNPQFILVNSSSSGKGGLDLSKVDINDLVRQAGIFAATQEGLSDTKTAPNSQPKINVERSADREKPKDSNVSP